MKESVIKIAVAVVLLLIAVYIEHNFELPTWQLLLIYLVPYLVVGLDTIKEAIEGVMEGEPFDENFLMTIATLGALCIGFLPGAETQFPEAVFVMLFFQIGELSIKEIAHETGVSESLVKVRIFRAKEKLKTILADLR